MNLSQATPTNSSTASHLHLHNIKANYPLYNTLDTSDTISPSNKLLTPTQLFHILTQKICRSPQSFSKIKSAPLNPHLLHLPPKSPVSARSPAPLNLHHLLHLHRKPQYHKHKTLSGSDQSPPMWSTRSLQTPARGRIL